MEWRHGLIPKPRAGFVFSRLFGTCKTNCAVPKILQLSHFVPVGADLAPYLYWKIVGVVQPFTLHVSKFCHAAQSAANPHGFQEHYKTRSPSTATRIADQVIDIPIAP